MNGEFLEALQQIAKEKDIPLETLVETVESALATAYKRNFATGSEIHGEIRVRIDSSKSANTPFKIFCEKLVVNEVENDYEQIALTDAREFNRDVMVGETVEIPIHPGNFGRIAAQTVTVLASVIVAAGLFLLAFVSFAVAFYFWLASFTPPASVGACGPRRYRARVRRHWQAAQSHTCRRVGNRRLD